MSTKVLHLSDLHIECERPDDEIAKFEIIIKYIQKHYLIDDTIIVITGDIDDIPRSRNYSCSSLLMKRLYDLKYIVLPVPGNHDFKEGDGSDHWNSMKEFIDRILKPNQVAAIKNWEFPLNIPYKYQKGNIYFFGVNSLNRLEGHYQLAEGRIGEKQTQKLIKEIDLVKSDDNLIVVILHHHPFLISLGDYGILAWHKLVDGYEFLEAIRDKVDILMFGHEHIHFKMLNKYGVRYILCCTWSTNPKMIEYTILPDKTIMPISGSNEPGLLGWEIEIVNKNKINIEKVYFK